MSSWTMVFTKECCVSVQKVDIWQGSKTKASKLKGITQLQTSNEKVTKS